MLKCAHSASHSGQFCRIIKLRYLTRMHLLKPNSFFRLRTFITWLLRGSVAEKHVGLFTASLKIMTHWSLSALYSRPEDPEHLRAAGCIHKRLH